MAVSPRQKAPTSDTGLAVLRYCDTRVGWEEVSLEGKLRAVENRLFLDDGPIDVENLVVSALWNPDDSAAGQRKTSAGVVYLSNNRQLETAARRESDLRFHTYDAHSGRALPYARLAVVLGRWVMTSVAPAPLLAKTMAAPLVSLRVSPLG